MAFDNVVFPRELSALSAGSRWNNTVVQLGGGTEQRNVNWGDARRRFNASNPTLTLVQLRQIEKHFNARRGRGRSFPLRDRSLFQATTEVFGTGDGVTTAFQLMINDGDSGNAYNREIYLPENGTVLIYKNTVLQTLTTHYTINHSTGIVTFITAPPVGHSLTWTGNFYVPARYDIDEFPDSRLFVWRNDGTGLADGPEIPLVETRDYS